MTNDFFAIYSPEARRRDVAQLAHQAELAQQAVPCAPAADERSADERSPEERRLCEQLYAARHAYRVTEERNKQLEEQVWRLSQDLSQARVVRIISEKEVRKWQEQVEQLSRDLSKATCLEFPQND